MAILEQVKFFGAVNEDNFIHFDNKHVQLVRFDQEISGFTDADNEYQASRFGIQVTFQSAENADPGFVGVFTLDGDALGYTASAWELVDSTDNIPPTILEIFQENWK